MSTPPDAMQAQMGGAPQQDAQQGGDAAVPPGAAPMANPSPQAGMKESAKVQVQMAIKILERSLSAFGFDSPEGKAVMEMIQKATKAFGKSEDKSQELMPAEIKLMMQQLSGGQKPGGPPKSGPGQMPQVQMPQMPQ